MPDFDFDLKYDKNKDSNQKTEIFTRNLVTEEYDPFDLNLNRVKPKVRFHENSYQSVNIPEVKFSNKIPSKHDEKPVESYILMAMEKLFEDNECVINHCEPISFNEKHKTRIRRILNEYLDNVFIEDNEEYFRKSDIRTDSLIRNRGAFRVVSHYQIKPKTDHRQRHSKHFINIILFDPHHLFIPSRYDNQTAEEYQESKYQEIAHFGDHIKTLFDKQY